MQNTQATDTEQQIERALRSWDFWSTFVGVSANVREYRALANAIESGAAHVIAEVYPHNNVPEHATFWTFRASDNARLLAIDSSGEIRWDI